MIGLCSSLANLWIDIFLKELHSIPLPATDLSKSEKDFLSKNS